MTKLPPPLPPSYAEPLVDPREIGRVVGTVLLASGTPSAADVAAANQALARLGRPPLAERDATVSTPEELGPRIPAEQRELVADVLLALSEDEPLRRRVALSYLALWELPLPSPTPEKTRAKEARIARLLIGALPRHTETFVFEERTMQQGVYRRNDVEAETAPPVRDPLRARVERIRAEYLDVAAAVERVIIGKRAVVERVLTAMAARGHVLLVDVPGVGKTQLCKALAAVIESRFNRIQFTPDLLPMDITGANVFDMRDKQFQFRPGPVFTHILLADEINRATPKTQSALLEVMEERCVTVDGTTHHLEEPFQVLATMNPIDHQGTYALPAAQIDRFMVMLEIGFPSPDDEVKVLDYHLGAQSPLATLRPVISRASFTAWRDTVPMIHVTPEIKRAAVDFINGLRRGAEDGVSVSPRATLAWVRAAQARAMLAGREFVALEDLHEVAPDVMRHRLGVDRAAVRERLRVLGGKQ